MFKRIKRILAAVCAVIFSPIWIIYWIISGRNIIFELMDYATDN
jgi:hypothetical protein